MVTKERSPKVEVEASYSVLKVRINGLPHVCLDKTKLLGFDSWFVRSSKSFHIAWWMQNAPYLETEYDDRALWEAILRKLGGVF